MEGASGELHQHDTSFRSTVFGGASSKAPATELSQGTKGRLSARVAGARRSQTARNSSWPGSSPPFLPDGCDRQSLPGRKRWQTQWVEQSGALELASGSGLGL